MKLITLKEAESIALGHPNVPKTKPGLYAAAERYGFLINKPKGVVYTAPMIDYNKFRKYLEFIQNHHSLSDIAKELNITVGGLVPTLYIRLGIKGKRKYGKTYYTRQERDRIIGYFKDKKRNNEPKEGK